MSLHQPEQHFTRHMIRERAAARTRHHRLPVMLSGDPKWLATQLHSLLNTLEISSPVLFSNHLNGVDLPVTPWKQASTLLGQTIDTLILDLTDDVPADALGIVTGALQGGGFLVLLCPNQLQWQPSPPFLTRVSRVLTQSGIDHLSQEQGLIPANPTPANPSPVTAEIPFPCATADQQQAVTAIKRVKNGHRRRPLVLTADRGRGKSSAMGIAAAQLMREETSLRILVTGPSRKTTDTLFYHAGTLLPEARHRKGHLTLNDCELLFVAPDELARTRHTASLVLVDEAAALPAPLLTHLLKRYARITFASTIHGYEGTGRGFSIRFRKTLDALTPKWNHCQMQQPVRWAEHDPAEQLTNRLLLLDAEAAPTELVTGVTPDQTTYQTITGAELAANESLLTELFGLLVMAHYQTSPDDLRQLLDRNDLTIALLTVNHNIISAALVSHEGGFDQDLARLIWSGKRRPKGHLLPQTLAVHAGHPEAPMLKMARIMRIAVHPTAQQQGLGQHLVQKLTLSMAEAGMDILGSSFGVTSDLLRFWNNCQLEPVHIGSTRNAASGCHSVVVSYPLNTSGTAFHKQSRQRFDRALPLLATHSLNALESDILLLLFQYADRELSSADRTQLEFFAKGLLNIETCLPELTAMAQTLLPRYSHSLDEQQKQLLTGFLLQKRSWPEVIDHCDLTGKKTAEQIMICSAASLLAQQG